MSELINMLLFLFSDKKSIVQALQNLRGETPKPTTTTTAPSNVTPLPTTPTIDRRISTVSEILEKVSCCKASS